MSIAQTRINGYPTLGSSPVRWTYKEGVRPHVELIDVSPDVASTLKAQAGKPMVLRFTVNGITRQIENLWMIGLVPSDNPQIIRVQLADRRWMLPYFHYLRRFNMRRNIGYKRVGDLMQPVIMPVVPDVWYWKWSLKDPDKKPPEGKWQPHEALENVLQAIEASEKEYSKRAGGYEIRKEVKATEKKLSMENFVIDDSGDACLLRLLALFPQAGIYVNDLGKYVVYSKANGGEAAVIKQLGPEIVGGGHAMLVTHEFERPKEIEVRFSMEVEVRHDFIQSTTGTTSELKDVRRLRNMIAVPDYALTMGGTTVVQGTWVDLEAILTAWGTPPGVGGDRITHDILEKAALPYLDLWAALQLVGLREPDRDWVARVGALQRCWRRIYGINPNIMDRTLQVKGYRVGLVDVANGTNGPAQAWCDHSFIGTQRSFFKSVQNNATLEPFMNVTGYPAGGQVPGISAPPGALSFTNQSKPAPAEVRVEDGDQGIVIVDFKADQNHMFEAALPGKIVRADGGAFGPTDSIKNPGGDSPIGFDMVTGANQVPKLSGDFKLALIVTHVPASPNDERQLFSVTVKPDDIKELLPTGLSKTISNAKGPKWVVRVRAGADSARAIIRWDDSKAVEIEKIFGIGPPQQPGEKPPKPNFDGLVLNALPQNKIQADQAASLNEIANAIAASIYARFGDRIEGQATGHLHSGIAIDGWMDEITVQVDQKGVGTAMIKLAQEPTPTDFRALLDSGTRAILDRIPHPGK